MWHIGIDLGGTNIVVGLVAQDGTVHAKDSAPTRNHPAPEDIVQDMVALCHKVMGAANVAIADVCAIGVGCPGTVDSANGVAVYANNLNFDNTPVCALMHSAMGVPVYLENDANCAALGESVAGAAKHVRHSITITLGTGVGGGIIVDNHILTGAFAGGGEVGHHVICQQGAQCSCGRKGCWEAYASATGLIREAKAAALSHPSSLLNAQDSITGRTVFHASAQGDATATTVVDAYAQHVACGLTNLINIFQPEMVVVGGGIGAQGETLLVPVRAYVAAEVYGGHLQTAIVSATCGNDAGVIGAAMLGRQYNTII